LGGGLEKMKRCPQCNRLESDDALTFCRADGTALVNESGSIGSDAGTARFGSAPASGEIQTSILPHTSPTPEINRSTGPTTVLSGMQPSETTRELTKRRRLTVVIPVAALFLIVAIVAGYFYFSRKNNIAIQSIAVMPFVNESGNTDLEYLSDGMTETLINNLSQLPNLSVKARSTVFHFKGKGATPQQVGSELSVQAVLNGRVTQHNDQLTLSLELVDARTGDQIWGEQYNRKTADLAALQNQIARDVSSKLRTKLPMANEQKLTRNYTENAEAYKQYLQGVFYWNKLNAPKAIECFNQAVAIDPNYALAYSGLGDSYLLSVVNGAQYTGDAAEALLKARECASKALELDKDLPDAHGLMGLVLLTQDHDFAGFEREITRAIELNPNYAEGHRRNGIRLFYLGQFDAAMYEFRKALDLDPLSDLTNFNYAQTLLYQGKYDEAEVRIRKNLDMDPGFALFHSQLSTLFRLKGNYAAAVEESAKASEVQNHPETARVKRESFAKGGWQGYLRGLVMDLEQNKSNRYWLATAYVELGEKDKAFAALEEVYNSHSNFVGYFKIDPLLNPLRDDPRFAVLLKRAGFPQ
jgi:TolB-like protein/Tfp pilus assembly protein PilF